MFTTAVAFVKGFLPRPFKRCLKALRSGRDLRACASFLFTRRPGTSVFARLRIVKQLYVITSHVPSPHTQEEIIAFIDAILRLPPEREGVVVEAGCYKGSSTAKFSLAAELAGRQLVVFDSFRGIPENTEAHGRDIFGVEANFDAGDLSGTLEEVKANVSRFGKIDRCRFVEGWFEDTMPGFADPVAAVYLDVDLASSTRTCLKYLYPRLAPRGELYSQDGHLPLIIERFRDDAFWRTEIGCERPQAEGLGQRKLIKVVKPG